MVAVVNRPTLADLANTKRGVSSNDPPDREKKGALLLSKVVGVRMGYNLGFIEKVVLVDGTILENMNVLYRAPIPKPKQFDAIFHAAAEVSFRAIGAADENWSERPGTMKQIFGKKDVKV